jgi:PAS domain S-box-containing protein
VNDIKKILIIEDDGIIAKDLENILSSKGYDVCGIASTVEESISKFESTDPDLILADIIIKGFGDGIEAANKIKKKKNVPVIYLSAYTDDMTIERAKITEPYGYILKPFDEKELLITIEMALYKHSIYANIKEKSEKFKELIDAKKELAILVSADGTVLAINQYGISYLRLKEEEIIGEKIGNLISKNKNFLLPNINRVLNYGEDVVFEEEIDDRFYEYSVNPIYDIDKTISKIAIYVKDITERKNFERSLEKEYDDFKQNQKELIKSEILQYMNTLISNIAKECNEPILNIKTAAEFCLEKLEPEERTKEFLKEILKNSNKIDDVIRELVEYIDLPKFSINQADILKIIQKAIDTVKKSNKNIEVIKKFPRKTIVVPIDEKWILIALLKVLTNSAEAIEKEGLLSIEVANDDAYLNLIISDNGKGISKENLDKVFDLFFTTKKNSLGLGLPLAYKIIKAHNGKINIESERGKGTKVIISLPY